MRIKSTETCLTCKHFNRCNNPDKAFGFSCLDYTHVGGISSELLLEDMYSMATDDLSLPPTTADVLDADKASKLENGLVDYLESVISDPNPIPRDLKFDDSDFPEFPNFYEWCMSPEGANTPPFARQLAIGIHLFAEYCPRASCTHPRFLNIDTVPYKITADRIPEFVTFLNFGVCPKCGARKSDLVKNGELALYDEFAGAIGQRGGKSAMFSLFAPYVIHKYLKMQNPNKFFGLMQNTIMSSTFVGLTFARAMSLLWTPILNVLRESVWFDGYHRHIESLGERYGVTSIVVKDTFVDYRHRRIRLYPSGPNKRTLRGDTRFLCFKGDQLVDTDKGLIPISDVAKGMVVYKGKDERTILAQKNTGYREDMLTVNLENGIPLTVTSDHRILTLNNNLEEEWVEAQNLNDSTYVSVTMGTGYRDEELPLGFIKDYMVDSPSRKTESALFEMEKGEFTLASIQDAIGEFKGLTALTSKLRKDGFLNRKRGAGNFMRYTLTEKADKILRTWGYGDYGTGIINTRNNAFKFPTETSYALGWLLGAMVCDGSYNSDVEFSYNTSNPEKLKIFLHIVKSLFGLQLSTTEYLSKAKGTMFKVHLGNRYLIQFLRYVGLGRTTSRTKQMPWVIRLGSSETIRGYIKSSMLHDGRCNGVLAYSTFSPMLAEHMCLLLIKGGFVASISHRSDGEKVVVCRAYEQLLDWLDFTKGADKYLSKTRTFDIDNLVQSQGYGRYRYQVVPYRKDECRGNVYYYTRKNTVPVPKDVKDFIRKYKDSNILWVKVDSVVSADPCEVYDIAVSAEDKTFAIQGINAHNSGIDEAGWFHSGADDDEERERASGKEVHGALDRSLKTVRMASKKKIMSGYDNLVPGYNISISSPSHPNDLIMYLTNLYKGSKDCLAVRLPTWKFNPLYDGREDFKKEYEENYARAERDFGANPMVNENRAFTESEVKAVASNVQGINLVTITTETYSQADKVYIKPKVLKMIANNHPSVLSLDAGETDNSFSLSLVQRRDENSLPIVSALIEIMPANDGSTINFNKVHTDLFRELFNVYNICGVVTDRWQSTAILHRLAEEYGVFVKTITAKESHFLVFSSYHRPDPMISYPKPEITIDEIMSPTSSDSYRVVYRNKPVAHFFHQLNTVQDINGVYDKGVGNTDDLVRATVLGINLITDPTFVERYLKQRAPKSTNAVGAVGAMTGAYLNPGMATIPGLAVSSAGLSTGQLPNTGSGGFISSRNIGFKR